MAATAETQATADIPAMLSPIDPTKNVLDLVKAESRYQDGMRDGLAQLVAAKAEGDRNLQAAKTEAEIRRLDQLAAQAKTYETRIAEMLRTSVESTSTLVSTQLLQIQSTFNERVAKLEQFRYESSGKTSVSDPALASALASIGSGMTTMQAAFIESLGKMAAVNAEATDKMVSSIASIKSQQTMTEGVSRGGRDVSTSTRTLIFSIIATAIGVTGAAVAIIELVLRH